MSYISQQYPDVRNKIDDLLKDYYINTLSPGVTCNVFKKTNTSSNELVPF